jgi:hypothetical protein
MCLVDSSISTAPSSQSGFSAGRAATVSVAMRASPSCRSGGRAGLLGHNVDDLNGRFGGTEAGTKAGA